HTCGPAMRPPSLRIRSVPRRDFTDELLARLHALANQFLVEDPAHFRVHAESNDVVHIFESGGALAGFQFWRTAPIDLPGGRAILGGKLRVAPEPRRRGLPLRSGLRFYLQTQLRHPTVRYYRLALTSIFGFVSITEALAEYTLFDPRAEGPEGRAIHAAFARIAVENHFTLDEKTGLFDVGQSISDEQLSGYPASWFERPAA